MPTDYEDWVDAQLYSEKASEKFANYKDVIFPLEKTKVKSVLDTMWKYVNLVSSQSFSSLKDLTGDSLPNHREL